MPSRLPMLGRYSLARALKVFAVIGALLISSVLHYCWWKNRPISTLTFNDGSKVHLTRITHGTVHDYYAFDPGDFFDPIRELFVKPQPYRTFDVVTTWHLRFEGGGTVKQVKAMGGMEDPIIVDCDDTPSFSPFLSPWESIHRADPVTLIWTRAYKQRLPVVNFNVWKGGQSYHWIVPNTRSEVGKDPASASR